MTDTVTPELLAELRKTPQHTGTSVNIVHPWRLIPATTLLALLDRIEADAQRIKELETWGARFRRDYGIPPEGSLGATWEATDGD